MTRVSMWPLLAMFLLTATTICRSAEPDPANPNILFIFMDDMGWRDAGCLGSHYYDTPNIDRLAHDGILFTDAYVNAPVCTPSRACIISGQTCPRHGVYIVSPDPSATEHWIEFFEDGHLELYNLHVDIGETNNLTGEMPDKARELHGMLQRWRTSLNAPLPKRRTHDY